MSGSIQFTYLSGDVPVDRPDPSPTGTNIALGKPARMSTSGNDWSVKHPAENGNDGNPNPDLDALRPGGYCAYATSVAGEAA